MLSTGGVKVKTGVTTGPDLLINVVSVPIMAWSRKVMLRGSGHPRESHKWQTLPANRVKNVQDYGVKIKQQISLSLHSSWLGLEGWKY